MIKKNMAPMIMMILIYFEIRDMENLFDEVSKEDYYKPILIKSYFKGITNIMKAEGIKKKDYQ